MGKYQSGQMGQTVNLLAYAFGGSNPSLPTKNCGSSSVDRALAFQAEGRGFEPRLPLLKILIPESGFRIFFIPQPVILKRRRLTRLTHCSWKFNPETIHLFYLELQ